MKYDQKLVYGGILVGALVLAVGLNSGSLLSFADSSTPRIDDCPPDFWTGDLSCSVDNRDDSQFDNRIISLSIADISGSSHAPVDRFLYLKGFAKESAPIDESYDRDGSGFSVDEYLRFNDEVRFRLEEGSTCRVRFSDLTSDSKTRFEVNDQEYRWEDDDDQDDKAPSIANLDFDPFWIEGDVVVEEDGYVRCAGIEYSEVIKRADGRVALDDTVSISDVPITESPGMALEMDFGLVSDGDSDGVIDSEDVCPEQFGELENGCPNTPPRVSVDAPNTVEDEEEFAVSATASDPDGQELTYSWSNGDTGRSTTYQFLESGTNQSISVSVSDGIDTSTESATVQVVDSTDSDGSDRRRGTASDGLLSILTELLRPVSDLLLG